DERLKKNIQPLGNFLEKLTELRPVTFEWKDPKKLNAKDGKHIGFIAQEVEKVFPHWVDTDKDGMKWLSMEGVNAAFVQSFKEVAFRLRSTNDSVSAVTQKIESLEKEKAANEKKISALEADNKRLHELVETLNASVGTHGRTSQRMEDRLNALERMQIATAAQAARK
ncbi:MAG TPA: tail fiber domain-containing protein, partial [Leptospiraceae bacterium]|nr:tail fiber domain-containing protein [Leptospiraceae bacterium]